MKRSPLYRGDTPLKRSGPLQRKTPLEGREPLKRSAQIERNSGLKPRSEKRAKVYEEDRVPFVKWFLETFTACQAKLNDCSTKSVDVHEVLSRARGGNIVPDLDDEGNYILDGQFMALCRPCHSFITEHPVFAEVMGFSRKSPPPTAEAS